MSREERIREIKNKILQEKRYVSFEQARIITRIYKETEGEAKALRRAKSFSAACDEIPISIDPVELIVGNRTPDRRAGVVFPEAGLNWLGEEIDQLPFREQDQFYIREKDAGILKDELLPYWKGKTLEDHIKFGHRGEWIRRNEKVIKINQKDHAQGHIIPDVNSWLKKGPGGFLKEFRAAADREQNPEKKLFYDSVSISLEGAIRFMQRYAILAREMAEDAHGNYIKLHLRNISKTCEKLAHGVPDTFQEAVQSVWFLFVLLQLESNASSFSPGRMDQYLYPFFKKDLDSGLLTSERALEIISFLWLKFNEIVYMRNSQSAKYFAGFPIGFNVAVGGVDLAGKPAENELSYIMLEAQSRLGLPQPNLSARLSRNTPMKFIEACTRVISGGSGMPQIFNDEAVIPALVNQGISKEDAQDYGIVGCVELSTNGNYLGWSDAAMFNMVKVIELSMNNGSCMLTGEQIGPETGYLNDFGDYEEFECAIEQQMDHFIDIMMSLTGFVENTHRDLLPSPFLSSVIYDCLGKGKDVTSGGAHYNYSGIQFIQVANVADSLAAIKLFLFEKKEIGATGLMKMLKDNFSGDEITRQKLIRHIPKYGNDVKWVDYIGLKWAQKFADRISNYNNTRNGKCHTGFYTVSAHVPMGSHVGATPDGRLAQSPLADGGLSAVYGRDINGPTALLHSVSRIDSLLGSNGTLLNMKFLPSFFSSPQGIHKFSCFLKGFIELKITHIQFNVLTREDLVKAKENPEHYRNLTVRVAGYTAYFTELAEDLQNEIIDRTEHG